MAKGRYDNLRDYCIKNPADNKPLREIVLNDVNDYFFFFAGDLTPRGAGLEGFVFLAVEGLDARFLLEAEGFAEVAAFFLLADFFNFDFNNPLGKGSVLREAEAGVTVGFEAGAGGGIFFTASCQLGKKSSMR
jgi:hypothetical protein